MGGDGASLRNAVKRREHKERAQPARRARYGLLEKHKDYTERARDYNKKQDHLNYLKEKAAFRNPDEFYFGMQNAKTSRGVHVEDKKSKYTEEELRVMRTQDIKYLQTRSTIERKKIEKLRGTLHRVDEAGTCNTHLRLGEDGEVEKVENKRKVSAKRKRGKRGKAGGKLYSELDQREERLKKITKLEGVMQLQSIKATNGRKRKEKVTLDDEEHGTKEVIQYKFKRERKR